VLNQNKRIVIPYDLCSEPNVQIQLGKNYNERHKKKGLIDQLPEKTIMSPINCRCS